MNETSTKINILLNKYCFSFVYDNNRSILSADLNLESIWIDCPRKGGY